MNTGTCKGVLLGSLLLGLAACEDFAALDLAGATTGENLALRDATLASGTVKLVPPNGFCIDKRSLRRSFALMARCDTLGGTLLTDAPLAIITATTVAVSGAAEISPSDFETTSENVLQTVDDGTLALVQVQGAPLSDGMRDTYWRAATRIGNHVMGLASYEPADAQALGSRAPALLTQTATRSQEQSVVAAITVKDNSATPDTKDTRTGFFAGLFE